ncbi:MAG: hypothetical protein AAGA20_07300 [Planctomycetota bacterium]
MSALVRALAPLFALAALGCGTLGSFGADPTRVDMEEAQSLVLEHDAGEVWDRTKETLAHLSSRVPRFEDGSGRAFAAVEDGSVVAEVVELSPGSARLAVRARRYGREDDALALRVIGHIVDEVER